MADAKRLSWGLLGTARINRAVIDPIQSSKNSQLFSVASRSKDKAEAYAKTWGIKKYYGNYEALLADPEIDVVYISLPNSLHAEWSIKAMQMGKHVLCEKPLATSIKAVDEIKKASQDTGKVIAEAFMYRHHFQTIKVKEMVNQGMIGKLQLIHGSFCYTNTRPDNIRLDPGLGGGSLWDVGCYPISYARFLTGEEPIEAYGHQVTGPTGIDLLYAGQLKFPGDVICQFESSFITPDKSEMEITGEYGRIIIPQPYKPKKKTKIHLEQEGRTLPINIKGLDLYQGEIEDIENAVLFGRPTRISLDESRGNVATIEALYSSARLFQTINLSGR
jgi:xylose dehydrogenase (NAD/NADP)